MIAVGRMRRGMNIFRSLLICLFLLFLPVRAHPGDPPSPKKIIKRYNKILHNCFPDAGDGDGSLDAARANELIAQLSRLASLPISDREILPKLDFLGSYEVIACLEKKTDPRTKDLVAEWKEGLVRLDIRAHNNNRYFIRPSALWTIRMGRRIPAQPTRKMLKGYIEREDNTVYISESGKECHGSKKGCERLRYVLLRCLVPGIHDPEKARALLHEYPPVWANNRMVNYLEVPLSKKTRLCRRNYYLTPFPGYKGVMENYYEIAFADSQRVIILEQNTRRGRFIIRTDNGGVFIQSPPHGVTVALLFSGKYIMEKFFRILVGDKLLVEPAQVLSVLRQHIMHPDRDPEETAEAGRRDFEEKEHLK